MSFFCGSRLVSMVRNWFAFWGIVDFSSGSGSWRSCSLTRESKVKKVKVNGFVDRGPCLRNSGELFGRRQARSSPAAASQRARTSTAPETTEVHCRLVNKASGEGGQWLHFQTRVRRHRIHCHRVRHLVIQKSQILYMHPTSIQFQAPPFPSLRRRLGTVSTSLVLLPNYDTVQTQWGKKRINQPPWWEVKSRQL